MPYEGQVGVENESQIAFSHGGKNGSRFMAADSEK
jgi:hypothetical protein